MKPLFVTSAKSKRSITLLVAGILFTAFTSGSDSAALSQELRQYYPARIQKFNNYSTAARLKSNSTTNIPADLELLGIEVEFDNKIKPAEMSGPPIAVSELSSSAGNMSQISLSIKGFTPAVSAQGGSLQELNLGSGTITLSMTRKATAADPPPVKATVSAASTIDLSFATASTSPSFVNSFADTLFNTLRR